ncbi:MAG: glycosyltransferase [Leptolyngbya sp. SIO1D8]|nr:glycosyltransferase [Leptolyngbya sp. SIO1D8]
MVPSSTRQRPRSMSAQLNGLIFFLFSIAGLISLYLLQNPGYLTIWDVFGLIGLGVIGVWRWSWFLLRMLRARYYLHWVFPRWRRLANQVPVEDLPHMCFLVPTYKEQPWITKRVFQAIAYEAKTLAQPITVLVNSSSDEENADIRRILEQEDPELSSIRLVQMTQKDGKRKAMADSLKVLAQLNLPADTVIALMDGDSELMPGTLRRCLPFFRLFPKMGALTTDELPVVQGSYFFSEWFHLRFAQRHLQMCSDSLSHKVMCLTGRFSLFRAEAALQPSFSAQLEEDFLNDWLWGRFKFLSGDDKSTWYWLLRHKYDMLYVPDAIVNSIETLSGSVIDRAYNNMRRWYGNMLRNNGRATALGPNTTGWFTWYSLIDQRISFWTCLITPGFLLLSFLQGHWKAAAIVLSWVFFSRSLMLILTFWGRISILKPIHFPLLLVSQWGGSLVKIWTQMNLAQQKWTNRGSQSISAAGKGMERVVKLGTSRLLMYIQIFSFVVFLCWLSGSLNPTWDIAGWQLSYQAARASSSLQVVEAIDYGVWPNDGKDDGAALQAIIDNLAPQIPAEVRLPIGELELLQPISINRSYLTLKGQGPRRTVIQAHYASTEADAILQIQPTHSADSASTAETLEHIHLQGFSIRAANSPSAQTPEVDGILLKQVMGGSLSHLKIAPGSRNPLVLDQTQDIKMEYVTFQETPAPAKAVVHTEPPST